MNNNSQEKFEEDLQKLVVDAKNLVNDAGDIGITEAQDFRDKTISILNKIISKISETEKSVITGVKSVSVKADEFVHQKPWTAVAVAAVIAGLIGLVVRKRR